MPRYPTSSITTAALTSSFAFSCFFSTSRTTTSPTIHNRQKPQKGGRLPWILYERGNRGNLGTFLGTKKKDFSHSTARFPLFPKRAVFSQTDKQMTSRQREHKIDNETIKCHQIVFTCCCVVGYRLLIYRLLACCTLSHSNRKEHLNESTDSSCRLIDSRQW